MIVRTHIISYSHLIVNTVFLNLHFIHNHRNALEESYADLACEKPTRIIQEGAARHAFSNPHPHFANSLPIHNAFTDS